VRQEAPVALLVSTIVCVIFVNLILAQVITQAFYPGAPVRLGPAVLTALGIAAIAVIAYVVLGWRSYLRRRPDEPPRR
jgi:hypothetical protein